MTAIICLGHSFGNKKRLTDLKLRVKKSVELYKEGRGSKIIFTGGFTSAFDISEAQLMSDIAQSFGIPRDAIILEEEAITTVGNAICTKKILNKNGFDSAVVVTSPTHLRRAKHVFCKTISGKHLEFVESENNAKLLKSTIRHLVEICKLGKDSILLNLNSKRTNFIETQ
ncbi:MAG: YdcF family protein [Candidatus Colwellbacteria bacterium]|nr:YdcF family protein [Candidatus Colwellbacteria bacterium]